MSPAQLASEGHTVVVVLRAVIDGAHTIPQICETTALAQSTVHYHLKHLRAMGLVNWVDGLSGTYHTLVQEVPIPQKTQEPSSGERQ